MKHLLAVLFLTLSAVAFAAPVAQDPMPGCDPCTLPPAPSSPIR